MCVRWGRAAALALVPVACCFVVSGAVGPDSDIDAGPGIRIELISDGVWSWLPDPRAVCYAGEHSRTYVGWVDGEGEVWVGSYDHAAGTTEVAVLSENLGGDDHSNPSILVLPDGRVMAFYSAHCGEAIWSRVTIAPEDITEWSEQRAITGVRPFFRSRWGYTYANAVRLEGENGRIYVFYRGPDFKQWFVMSDDGRSWSEEKPLMRGQGTKPYFKYASNGDEAIHIAFTDGHPRGEETNSIYYMRYTNGAFFKANGSEIKSLEELPVSPGEADKVYDGAADGVRSWIWDIAVDDLGHPVLVYAVFPAPDDHRYRYARWNGTQWLDCEITSGGSSFPDTRTRRRGRSGRPLHYLSGGAAVDPSTTSLLYLSREVHGVHEVEEWSTPDAGLTWSARPVTSGSETDNVRPVVPRASVPGAPEVLWLSGSYDDYDAYDMGIWMFIPNPVEP